VTCTASLWRAKCLPFGKFVKNMADAVGEEDAIPAPKLKEKVQKHMEYAQRKQSKDLLGVLLLLAMTLCLLLQNT